MAGRAGSLDPAAMDATADGTTVTGGRGTVTVTARHVDQRVYLARAGGLDFDVLDAPVAADRGRGPSVRVRMGL
ncbi:hypothetical protein [Dactylosporangium sp. CA-233914]|uniref:hypothetical protein n=1 Tax=Dactylosporangium sp. CA-233914 TaxID=3239934 RepID=UPI003D93D28A